MLHTQLPEAAEPRGPISTMPQPCCPARSLSPAPPVDAPDDQACVQGGPNKGLPRIGGSEIGLSSAPAPVVSQIEGEEREGITDPLHTRPIHSLTSFALT